MSFYFNVFFYIPVLDFDVSFFFIFQTISDQILELNNLDEENYIFYFNKL